MAHIELVVRENALLHHTEGENQQDEDQQDRPEE